MIAADIYDDVRDVLGTSDASKIYSMMTKAVQLLAKKADWDPLIGFVDICCGTDQRTITLPVDVETPMTVMIGGQPMMMRGKWAEFHLNGGGMQGETGWTWDDQGYFPVFQDIKSPSVLICVAQLQNDLGTPVRVFGLDQMGRQMRTQAPDGSWQDGALIPANVMADFPNGIIRPDTQRYFYRIFSKTPTTEFFAPNHGFITGAEVIFTLTTAPIPTPLLGGVSYFVGVVDLNNIQLFATLQGALTNVNPIVMTSVSPISILNFNDQRQIQVRTKFASATPLNFQQAEQVTFSGSPLPTPITPGEIFYINLIDSQNFTIHATADDANAGTNPLFVQDAGSSVVASGLQPATPYTKLTFAANHDFLQGDTVTVSNAGGILPSPLLPGTNYYVRYIDARNITLHVSLADAASGQNAIIFTDSGQGVTSVVKLINSSVNPGTQNNITAPNHNLLPGDFIQFQSSGTLPSPLQQNVVYEVGTPTSPNTLTLNSTSKSTSNTATRRRASNIAVITTASAHNLQSNDVVDVNAMADATYDSTQVAITVLDTTSFSYPNTGSNEGTIATVSRCRTGGIAVVTTASAHGISTGDFVYISGLGGAFSYNGWFQTTVIDATHFYYTNIGGNEGGAPTSSRARASNIATIVTGLDHGFSTGNLVNIQGVGSGYDAFGVTVTVTNATTFTYANTGSNESTTSDLSGYCATGVADTNGLVAKGVADTQGVVTYGSINITDVGTGILFTVISRALTIGFTNGWFVDTTNLTTGSEIELATDGSLPAAIPPIQPLTDYWVRVLDAFTAQLYTTQAKALDAAARSTVSRARASNIATIVTASAHGFATNDYVNIANLGGTGYNIQGAQITVVSPTSFTYVSTGSDESASGDTGGLVTFSSIQITGLGSGNYYFSLSAAVSVAFLTNGMDIDNALYFAAGTPVTLTSSGVLPAPLQTGTTYLASLDSNNLLTFTQTDGTPILLTTIGSGIDYLNHAINASVNIPNTIEIAANEYQTGDAVLTNTDGTLPSPLQPGTTYYVRRISNGEIQLYDTFAHAVDLTSTTGVQQVLDAGSGNHRLEQYLDPLQFLKIERIRLNERLGFVDLFAWDYNRREDVTLVGHYHPIETNPRYRRIKSLNSSSWVRMRYKRRTYVISSSQDYIPLDSGPAVVKMIQSLDMFDKNFMDLGDKFEALATKWTKEDHDSRRGPEAIQIQMGPGTAENTSDGEGEWMT